jgi:hypothetical protein
MKREGTQGSYSGKVTLTGHHDLSRRAHTEVKKLLKRHDAGSITGVQLHTGLQAVERHLDKINFHYRDLS